MLTSLSLIFLLGIVLGRIFQKLHLPNLIGMLFTGIILGPYVLNLISPQLLNISADLRQIALIIILTRAGLSLDVEDLKRVGRPAVLMCFVPACFEILGMIIFAPGILGVSLFEAAIMGAVIAAVSPAVIVPKMLAIMETDYGKEKSIPQLIMAGASVDDVFVIVLFTSFLGIYQGENISVLNLLEIPISIITGIISGVIIGVFLIYLFKKIHLRDSLKVIIILSMSFLLVGFENVATMVPFSALLGVMSVGVTVMKKNSELSKRLSLKFSKLWTGAEILLFVLVGAMVNINYAMNAGVKVLILLILVLLFRMVGVFISLLATDLSIKEKIFCMIAYMPKATVQAAIGGIPLSLGLESGELILTVAVIAILFTAPVGATLVERFYKKLLVKETKVETVKPLGKY